jgi:hypothetical protein
MVVVPSKEPSGLFWNSSSGTVKLSEGHCRMCQRPKSVRPLTRHHLVPVRWFFGEGTPWRAVRNANANIVPLCRACHDLIEDGDLVARGMLGRLLTQQEIAFVIRLRGIQWLSAEYPLREEAVSRESSREDRGRDGTRPESHAA